MVLIVLERWKMSPIKPIMAAAITELFIYAVAVEVGVGVAVVVVQGRQEQAVLLSHAAQLALK